MNCNILSICIPTYNRQPLLQETLDCLIREISGIDEKDAVELCIVDNHSPDSTHAMLERYAAQYRFVRIFKNEINLGPDANFLLVLSKAQGEYLWLFGDDDLVAPGSVSFVMQQLKEKTPDLAWINYSRFVKKNDGAPKVIAEAMIPAKMENAEVFGDKKLFLSEISPCLTFMSCHIYKRSSLELLLKDSDYVDFIGSFMIHLFLFLQLACQGERFLLIRKPLVMQRSGESGDYAGLYVKLMFGTEQILRFFRTRYRLSLGKLERGSIVQLAIISLVLKAKGKWRARDIVLYALVWHWNRLLFWLVLLPVFLFPSFLAGPLYRFYKDRKHR